MPETLLRTKLFIPPRRPNLVSRPHLVERLNQGLHLGLKLTLVSAAAGFGKTTLVSLWVAACERPVAWLSLWGLITVFPLLIGTLMVVFGYEYPMFVALPYVPFEFVIGIWILVKGVQEGAGTKYPLRVEPRAVGS